MLSSKLISCRTFLVLLAHRIIMLTKLLGCCGLPFSLFTSFPLIRSSYTIGFRWSTHDYAFIITRKVSAQGLKIDPPADSFSTTRVYHSRFGDRFAIQTLMKAFSSICSDIARKEHAVLSLYPSGNFPRSVQLDRLYNIPQKIEILQGKFMEFTVFLVESCTLIFT